MERESPETGQWARRDRISVIVPAYNAAGYLPACLKALSRFAPEGTEVIVVDDGSTDDTVKVAQDLGARVVALPQNVGRGPARNAGAAAASHSILLFVDADVVVHADTLLQILDVFEGEPGLEALFGAYDTRPADPGFFSQYRNLLHHYVHHVSGPRAAHFWTGLGAVRRAAFQRVGGFNEGPWARYMEEIDFGAKLVRAGVTIHVRPNIQCTHLKAYTLRNMIKSDLFDRAIPWSRYMMMAGDGATNGFVVSQRQKVTVIAAGLMAMAPLILWVWPAALGSFLVGFGLLVGANLGLWHFFLRERGVVFMLKTIPCYALYGFCCGLGYAWTLTTFEVPRRLRGRRTVHKTTPQGETGPSS